MLSEKIISARIYRYSAKEVKNMFITREEVEKEMNQCSVCGYVYYKEDGYSNLLINEYQHDTICKNCVELLNSNIDIEKIPYSDEYFKIIL
ncbi:hypothetical protein [Clostridium massiliamazoniense]|uniref:hypothetical protein n=1 Tax=Clostridium massiliamazoniense TaxID=1347366 RepID=UPI0006D84D1A|nr:hypothetical protein [Clostridium massiliamazoniense]